MDLITAVKVTYEIVGQDISDLGIQSIVRELESYPLVAVLEALTRCRKELCKVTLADILDRLPNGHPGPEEAWSIVSRTLNNEAVSIVWTEEMAEAAGAARSLADDPVAARMAFKETYTALVQQSRLNQRPPQWRASLGFDPHGREQALKEAVEKNRIGLEYMRKLVPDMSRPMLPDVKRLIDGTGEAMGL